MSDELLIKEKELHRLNKEIEVKTRHVLEEINFITKRQEHNNLCRLEDKTHDTASLNNKDIKPPVIRNDKLTQNNTMCTLTEDLPNLSKQIFEKGQVGKIIKASDVLYVENSSENKILIEFLRSKIDMLHNELRVIQQEYKR